MTHFHRVMPFLLPVLLAAPAAAGERVTKSWALDFLGKNLGLTEDELRRVTHGQPVARTVEHAGGREIAVLGAVALPRPPAGWGGDYAAVERLRRASPDLIDMGPIGRPPTPADFARVELDDKTASQLPRCRPGRCVMNASAADIKRYEALEEAGGAAADQAHAVFREVLRERLAAYQQAGDTALPVLDNRRWKLTTADAPALLLDRKPGLAEIAPRIDARLRACAAGAPAAADDAFFWARERIWRKEVVGIYHAAFDEERTAGGRKRVLVEKLVWANHYLLGGLTITGVLEDSSGTYLFFLNRSETDNRGSFNFVQRALANRLLGGRLKRQMPGLRDALVSTVSAGGE